MTVCEVQRNDALKRVLAVAKGGKHPGDGAAPDSLGTTASGGVSASAEIAHAINLAQVARDSVVRGHARAGHLLDALRPLCSGC